MSEFHNIHTPSVANSKIMWLIPPALIVGAMTFLLVDIFGGSAIRHSGVIVEKSYKPERIHLTKVREMQPKGEFISYLAAETEPAEWAIFARSESGKIMRMECGRELYYSKNIGESVPYVSVQGCLTNWLYYNHGIARQALKKDKMATPSQAFRQMKIRTASI